MKLIKIIKSEFEKFSPKEKIIFPLVIFIIIGISLYLKDSKIALISAVCGVCYTIMAGKGRIICYFIGMSGTICYSYISFKNGFYGNLMLYLFYYFPMEIIGVFKWRKYLKKDSHEIIKTQLTKKERLIYFAAVIILSIVLSTILNFSNDKRPIMDGVSCSFSILGQFLTVKRCIEQWYVWFFVNVISLIMWFFAYIEGYQCFATLLMWGIYVILSVYFLNKWKKELNL